MLKNRTLSRSARRTKSVVLFTSVAAIFLASGCGLSGTQPVGFQDQIKIGEQFIEAGEYDRAYSILDGISENQRTQPAAQLAVADSYLRSNALLRAESAYSRAAELGDSFMAEVGMGKIALKRNRVDDARFHFQNAIDKRPESAEVWNGLGVSFDLSGQHKQAQDSYRKALELEPDYFQAMNNLGLSLVLGGNSASGVETLTLLSESRLDNAKTRMNLAIALNMSGFAKQSEELARTEVSAPAAQSIFKSVRSYVRSWS